MVPPLLHNVLGGPRVTGSARPTVVPRALTCSDEAAYTASLPRSPESAAAARRLVAEALHAWHLRELGDGAALVVTELVANAADHARGSSIRVTVTRTGRSRVRIAVVDKDRRRPECRPAASDDERGRGLLLVDAVSGLWGVDLLRWGKRVWAELDAAA